MAKISIHKQLVNELEENEPIVWSGHPQPYRLMSPPFSWRNIIRWVITVPIFVYFMTLCIMRFDGTVGSVFFYIILAAAPAVIAAVPFTQKREIERLTCYALTDSRLAAFTECSRADSFRFLPLAAIDRVEVEPTGGGRATVYVNAACKTKYGASRQRACENFMDDAHICRGLILYNIEDWQTLCAQLPAVYVLRPAHSEEVAGQCQTSEKPETIIP